MIGERLVKANYLARKRAGRFPGWEGETGRLRKERVLCNCSTCKASRKKRNGKKGVVKAKQMDAKRAV